MRFTIYKNAGGFFYWNLKSANGEIVAQSETYTSKQSALNAIHAIQAGAASASVHEATGS